MSKARLVITAVIVEKRPVSGVAREYGVARSWVYGLLARYQAEGEAAFEPRSRRPKTSPSAISDQTADLIVRLRKELAEQGMDAGAHTIRWHLEHHHGIAVPAAAISRYLSARGLIVPEPRKRPRSSCIRFQAGQPNECRQSDFTRYPLAGGTGTEILTWLGDHSRYALSVTAHERVTGRIVLNAFRDAVAAHGAPASTLTDNGMVFTTRFSGGKGGRNGLETELRSPGITQKNGKPQPPPDPGEGRAVPADPQELARRPEPAARHAGPAPVLPRRLRDRLQRAPAAPVTAAQRHSGHRLRRPAQGRPG
jgi:transposase